MKFKKKILLLGILVSFSLSCHSQIIYIEGEDANMRKGTSSIDINNPWGHGLGSDVYVPLGNGALLLSSLGILYLLKKRKNK
ncbi:MAG: hypothetical protein IKM99_06080 [Bacteroidales bacterium]|nr:hypothetical protein [Bacteroidales bacterium]